MDASRMVVRSLGALGSIQRIEERMRETGSDGLEIVDADGTVHSFDGANLSKAKLERTSEGWLWTCLREGRETVFQECVEGLVAIGATEMESRSGQSRGIVLEIERRAEEASLKAIAALLVKLAEEGVATLSLHGRGIVRLLLAIDVNVRFEILEITNSDPDRELNIAVLGRFQRHLEWLTLRGCNIACDGFAPICGMKRLETLQLDGVYMSEQEFAHLARLPKLSRLWLFDASLGEDAMSHISRCCGLTDLWISLRCTWAVPIRDLAKLTLLRQLVLNCPHVDDADVPFLLGLSNLDHLDVTQTGITEVGLKCLRKYLPDLGKLVPETRSQGEARRGIPMDFFNDHPGSVIAISERYPA